MYFLLSGMSLGYISDSIGYRLMRCLPHDFTTFAAKLMT